ncbi:MAG: hypothetical protein AAB664_01725, partial [Patescibacteria group bacterium]
PLIFYHFHSLKYFGIGNVQYHSYTYAISKEVHRWIYDPYLSEMDDVVKDVYRVYPNYPYGLDKKVARLEIAKQYIKRVLQNNIGFHV